MVKVKVNKTEG